MRMTKLLFGFFLIGATTSLAAENIVTVDDLVVAARAAREKLLTVQFYYTWKAEPLPDASPAMIRFEQGSVLYEVSTGRYCRETTYEQPKYQVPVGTSDAYDGRIRTTYSKRGNYGTIRELASPPNERRAMYPLFLGLMFPPAVQGMGLDDGSLVSLLSKSKLRANQEEVGGRKCYVAEFEVGKGTLAIVWVDLERGAMPVKQVTLGPGPNGNRKLGEVLITEAKAFRDEAGQQIWLPTRIELSYTTCRATVEVDVEKTKVNPTAQPASFRLQFPKGTRIVDTASGTAFQKDPTRPSMRGNGDAAVRPEAAGASDQK